jgi:hypothetical protein
LRLAAIEEARQRARREQEERDRRGAVHERAAGDQRAARRADAAAAQSEELREEERRSRLRAEAREADREAAQAAARADARRAAAMGTAREAGRADDRLRERRLEAIAATRSRSTQERRRERSEARRAKPRERPPVAAALPRRAPKVVEAKEPRRPDEPSALTQDQFLTLGLDGPASLATCPDRVRLPDVLFGGMRHQLGLALEDGLEHGGVFGGTGGASRYFTIAYVEGQVHQIDYAVVRGRWPTLKQAGTFHSHLYELIDTGNPDDPRWAGGAHSDTDLFNFFDREPHISAVMTQTRQGRMNIYLLLRPQTYTIPGGPRAVGAAYKRQVLALLRKGVDIVDASERELTNLAHRGVFALYTGTDTPDLARR